jgi:16S rRNA (cytosine967-C5)-methyltransferase
MIPAARLQAAIDLLVEINGTDRPADGVVSAYTRARRYMGSKDRKSVTDRLWAALRSRARLTWMVERFGGKPSARTLMIAHLLLGEGRSAQDLRPLFDTRMPHAPQPLSDQEQGLIDLLAGKPLEYREMPRETRLETPEWLFPRLEPIFGEALDAELAALLVEAPLDLRVNTLKGDRESTMAALAEEGIDAEPGTLSPWSLRLDGRPNIAATNTFRDGFVEVQDEGSQLIALLCGAEPGMSVLDLCAGAGGKTLALAAAMENKGGLVAADVNEGRLERAQTRLRRAEVHNVTRKPLGPEANKWLKRRRGTFDRVLVDAPCSGTGTWRRNPDARWKLTPETVESLVAEQAGILDRAAGLTKPGGRLIYATCALLPEENEGQVEALLSRRADYRALPVADLWPDLGVGDYPGDPEKPWLRLSPARHGTDGFFVAVLERIE